METSIRDSRNILTVAGSVAVGLAVLLMAIVTVQRFSLNAADPALTDEFNAHYVDHPWLGFMHVVPGLLFLMLGALQFIPQVRRKRPGVHRWIGRFLVGVALILGVNALIISFVFPTYGGATAQTATLFFGALFLCSALKGFGHIRRKAIALHREWMLRAYAIAAGVATARVFGLTVLSLSPDYTFDDLFGMFLWVGFGFNLIVAEVWIRTGRASRG